MNKTFDTGGFPEEWALGIIVILFKEGEKNDINNYRGITLLSVVGKLLVGMLNERLTKFVEKQKIVHENQAGFRKGIVQLTICLPSTLSYTIQSMLKRNHFMYALLILKRLLIKYHMHYFGKSW